jgi:hypothetical protein
LVAFHGHSTSLTEFPDRGMSAMPEDAVNPLALATFEVCADRRVLLQTINMPLENRYFSYALQLISGSAVPAVLTALSPANSSKNE